MTKIITISIILLCGITVSTSSANAAASNACTNAGHTVGTKCGSSSGTGTGTGASATENVITDSACINPNVSCKYAVCSGQCRCVPDGECGGGLGPVIDLHPCTTTPTWITSSQLCLQTGTCKNSAGTTITVYRCADGCYINGTTTSLYDYETSEIDCKACPTYPEDISLFLGIPSYVTTGGAGMNQISDCQIKANSSLKDSKGTFVFPTACSYTE